jgi:hypothetical protein
MRRLDCGIVAVLCLYCACSKDAKAKREPDAAVVAHESDAAQSADAGTPLMTLVQDEVALYDRRIRASCPCLVASGAYQTEQECLDLGLSGPDWVDCATKALADYDNPDTRAQSQCFTRFLTQVAECTEAAACDQDKLANCGAPDPDCLASQSTRINLILAACPDFGLLSRLNPR